MRHLLIVLACVVACGMDEDSVDGRDDAFLGSKEGKADGSDAVLARSPAVMRAILRIVNSADRDVLGKGTKCDCAAVGLAGVTVDAIVAARSIPSLEALDDVPYVGPIAFARLVKYVRDNVSLTNPNGPDLQINVDRLQASARVVHNAAPLPAEVQLGCASRPFGASLLRFDLAVANQGIADLDYSDASCRSTRQDSQCHAADCAASPECCRDNTFECPKYLGRDGDPIFRFEYPGGYIRFNSFAELHLYKDGSFAEVFTQQIPRKQAVSLADIEDLTGGSCDADKPFTGRHQGLHSGCTYVMSSALPCSYLDVTGLAPGKYWLEVRIDPLDVVNELNESNNVNMVAVNVTAPTMTTPTPNRPLFLSQDGIGTADEASQYYASLEPAGFSIGTYTLDRFRSDFMASGTTVTGYYRNAYDLGFWRDMTCSATIGRGVGACTVTNYTNYDDKQNGKPNLGTVAMRLDSRGRTQFFAFAPDGKLSPSAALDSEGQKAVPRLCTPCHLGEYGGPGSDPDVGGVFREFEPSLLEKRPGIVDSTAQREWKNLNVAIRGANKAVRSQAQGGTYPVDRAKTRMELLFTQLYPNDAATAVPLDADSRVPARWKTNSPTAPASLKVALWKNTVSHYCVPCHRINLYNFDNYPVFAQLAQAAEGETELQALIEFNPNDPNREIRPFMPQSKLAWERLRSDDNAMLRLEQWIDAATQ